MKVSINTSYSAVIKVSSQWSEKHTAERVQSIYLIHLKTPTATFMITPITTAILRLLVQIPSSQISTITTHITDYAEVPALIIVISCRDPNCQSDLSLSRNMTLRCHRRPISAR